MRPFEGFQRRAVVLVPSDDEFKKRCTQREKEEGKEVPDSAVLEMKGKQSKVTGEPKKSKTVTFLNRPTSILDRQAQ